MDILLGKVTQQAMNYAIRSGITITSTYAIRQCSRLVQNVKGDDRDELSILQDRLDSKIRIISPAIDMIELISARGNTSLESAVTLTKALRWDIQALGIRLANAANAEELSRRGSSKASSRAQNEVEFKLIIKDIRSLLSRIEDAVPLINLAITTSGASLSTKLPATISPSRLLQASTFLTAGDSQYSMQPNHTVQVGPAFTLSMYMLFAGHANREQDEEGTIRDTTWKEVIHKARVKLLRVPLERAYELPKPPANGRLRPGTSPKSSPRPSSPRPDTDAEPLPHHIHGEGKADEFAYQILIVEDLEDDRVHSFDEDDLQPTLYDDVRLAGIREVVPVHEISKIFYADTGKILNIGSEGETNSPVLLLKRDINAVPPRRMMERASRDHDWNDDQGDLDQPDDTTLSDEGQSEIDAQLGREERAASLPVVEEPAPPEPEAWRLPQNLDPEWLAFEVYSEEPDGSETEDESVTESDGASSTRPARASRETSLDPLLTTAMSSLHLNSPSPLRSSQQSAIHPIHSNITSTFLPPVPIRTSLSLLETLIRLTALQQFQQTSHLSITDELLNFFLSESSTTGAGPDGDERRRKRWEARQRLGFDPYDESPVKRRGEGGIIVRAGPDEEGGHRYDDGEAYAYDVLAEDSPSRWTGPAKSASPSPMLLRSRQHTPLSPPSASSSPQHASSFPSTPASAKGRPATLRQQVSGRSLPAVGGEKRGSPLGRGRGKSTETDSSLGTSPGYEEGTGGPG
ncbi:MAG: hypothetical protein M1817_000450 [Caeruleum heppii]|nr:MAG: hypothetical protein M1817_000450 [Caeruleum heppii]